MSKATDPPASGMAKLGLGNEKHQQETNPENHESSSDSDYEHTDNKKQAAKKPAGENPEENKVAIGKTFPSAEDIGAKLKEVILKHRKGLQNMYGETEQELDKNLKEPIKRGVDMARKLMETMGCGLEIAKVLTVLTLYDVAILIDDSDSMIKEENGARKTTLIQYIDSITEIYKMAKESGILAMRFMNRGGGKKDWNGNSSKDYLDKHEYGGVTRIGTELKRKVLDKFAIGKSNQAKPLLVLIVTDGAVEGERKGHLKNVIRDCVNERAEAKKGIDAVTFQFSRIGNDPGATQLLKELDQDADLGDFIDVLPVECDLKRQLEGDKWFVLPKILLGAILPDWDQEDYYDQKNYKNHLANNPKKEEDPDSGDEWDDKD
ncbi:hypothetical protein L873DRAFT_1841382 [Choiromyces venosus 120613-1]|uniref:VWFA domain-containing protein n=1 Tax=Choiromyces venosus 120613-1 TaxID=1336337 RepID=A0A3N4JXU2_9PEZI|nr:hypothetical protein L873DRAFT_1841382 [Choiromyces venosus 120613-1]